MQRIISLTVGLKEEFGRRRRGVMDTFRRVYHHAQRWKGALSRRKRAPDDDEKLISPEAELERINSCPGGSVRIRGQGQGWRLGRRSATRKNADFDSTRASMSLDLDYLAREANRTNISPDEWSLTEYRVLGTNGMTEISEVCKYLGLPGPEFLGIARDAWDAALVQHSGPADSTWELNSPSSTAPSCRFSIRNPIRKRKDNASRLSHVVPSDMSHHSSSEARVVRDKVSSDSNLAAHSLSTVRIPQLDLSDSRDRDREMANEGGLDPASVVTRETPKPGLEASSSSDGTEESIRRGLAPGPGLVIAGDSHERSSEVRQDLGREQDSEPGSLATSSLPKAELNLPSSAGGTPEEVADHMTAGGVAGTPASVNSNTDSRAPLAETSKRGETRHLEGESSEGQKMKGLDLEEGTTSSAGPGMSVNITHSLASPVKSSRSFDDDEIRIQELIFPGRRGDLLGAGSLGTVYEAIDRYGNVCAMKEVSFTKRDKHVQDTIFQIEQGVELLSGLKHKNIVHYLGTQRADGKIFIFQELVRKGSLVSLCKKVRFTNSLVIACTRQILKGLEYLHSVNICHRDIKCANILIDVHGTCKLADFGLANQIAVLEKIKFSKGSGYWMAPEVIDPKKTSSSSADIWSVGCAVIEMFTGSPPFGEMEWYRVMWKVGHGEAPPVPEDLSDDAKDFIRQCLRIEPSQRPTASMLLQHKFILTSLKHTISGD